MDLEYSFDEYRLSLYGTKDVLSTGLLAHTPAHVRNDWDIDEIGYGLTLHYYPFCIVYVDQTGIIRSSPENVSAGHQLITPLSSSSEQINIGV
jgi:hypothetical protein